MSASSIPTEDPNVRFSQLDSLMNAMVDAFIVIDGSGNIERFNKAAEDMFGYAADEIQGQNISVLMADHDRAHHDKYISRYRKTGKKKVIGVGREVIGRRSDKSEFPADIAVGEVRGADGSLHFIGLVRDLTELREAQAQSFRQRQEMLNTSRLSTMGEMAAAMAHELNQPLSAIANYSAASLRLLKNENTDLDTIKEALEQINNQAHRASEVIRRTRDFTRSTETRREMTTVPDIMREVLPLAELDAHANNIALEVDIADNLAGIEVDSLQIQQVLLNLLRNGVDAMQGVEPEFRRITVSALYSAPGELSIVVKDQGEGISAETAEKLFNPFFTTKNTGMGMGLAICRTIAEAHSGSLEFRRNPDRGVSFVLKLPTKATG